MNMHFRRDYISSLKTINAHIFVLQESLLEYFKMWVEGQQSWFIFLILIPNFTSLLYSENMEAIKIIQIQNL